MIFVCKRCELESEYALQKFHIIGPFTYDPETKRATGEVYCGSCHRYYIDELSRREEEIGRNLAEILAENLGD